MISLHLADVFKIWNMFIILGLDGRYEMSRAGETTIANKGGAHHKCKFAGFSSTPPTNN